METLYRKGDYKSECNRTACKNSNAIFYNYSTLKYYCGQCAYEINQWAQDFEKQNGHKLCVKAELIDLQKTATPTIKSDNTAVIQQLEAEKAELLEALEKTKNEMIQCLKFLRAEGYEHMEFENLSEVIYTIQKHKQ